jgi:hypothetical protein
MNGNARAMLIPAPAGTLRNTWNNGGLCLRKNARHKNGNAKAIPILAPLGVADFDYMPIRSQQRIGEAARLRIAGEPEQLNENQSGDWLWLEVTGDPAEHLEQWGLRKNARHKNGNAKAIPILVPFGDY